MQLHRQQKMQSAGFRSRARGNSKRARPVLIAKECFFVVLVSYCVARSVTSWTSARHSNHCTGTGSFKLTTSYSKFADVFQKKTRRKLPTNQQPSVTRLSHKTLSIIIINSIQTIHRFALEATPKPIISFLSTIQQKRTSASDIIV